MNWQGNLHLKSSWGIVPGQRSSMWPCQFPPLPYGSETGKGLEKMLKNSWSRHKRSGPKERNWNKDTRQVTKCGWKGATYRLIGHQSNLPQKDMDPSRSEKSYHPSLINWNFLCNGRSTMSSMQTSWPLITKPSSTDLTLRNPLLTLSMEKRSMKLKKSYNREGLKDSARYNIWSSGRGTQIQRTSGLTGTTYMQTKPWQTLKRKTLMWYCT